MRLNAASWGIVIAAAIALGGCSGATLGFNFGPSAAEQKAADDAINIYPENYKAEILAYLRSYLNDPTNVRDGAISEPAIRPPGKPGARYTVCLRYNAKKTGGAGYIGIKENVAVFVEGKLDKFGPPVSGICQDAVYASFPELGQLKR